jgi:ABC-type glycerol-3-phosphate transport system substrate-binding protein
MEVAGAGLAAILAGCSGSTNTGSNGTNAGGSSGENGSTTVVYWSSIVDDENIEPWNNWYKEQADVNVELQGFAYEDLQEKYLTGARTGTPDMVEGVLSHLSDYVKADLMAPLDERVGNKNNFDGYFDNTTNALRYQDALYGLPLDGNGRGLLYRKDILDKYGFDVPQTAEEFHEIGREINKNEDGMAGYQNCTKSGGIRAFQEWISHVYQQEEALYKVDGDSWTLVPSADTLGQIFDNWYAQVWAADQPLANTNNLGTGWQVLDPGYASGNFAMCPEGPWMKTAQQEASENASSILDDKTAVTHLPRGEGGEKGTYLEVEWTGINANTEKMDAAWEATDLYTSNASYQQFAEVSPGNWVTPIHDSIETTVDDEDWKPFAEVFKTGTALAFISWGSTRDALSESMQKVAYGESDPYKEGKTLHSRLQDIAQNELKV